MGLRAPPKISLAWQNLSKKLPLRAILFDARCILRTAEEADVEADKARNKALRQAGLVSAGLGLRQPSEMLAQGRIKDMLQSEMRDELSKRNLSTVGKPWELQARLKAVLEAEAVGIRAAPAASPPDAGALPTLDVSPSMAVNEPASTVPSTSSVSTAAAAAAASGSTSSPIGEASSAAAKRAQYAAKLRQRTGGSITADGTIAAPTALNQPRGGPEDPNVRPVDKEAMFRFQHGARDFLQYLDMRGIARVLLPSPDVETDEAASEEAAMLTRSLQVPAFALVLGRAEAVAARGAAGGSDASSTAAALLGVHAALELGATSELMVVSDDAALLRGAKKAGVFSCHYYRNVPGAAKSLPSNYRAATLAEVQTAVEELNGITFRDPSTEIRTKFGVYQT